MASPQERAPPSAAAIAIGSAIISGLMGYFLGQARSIGVFGSSLAPSPTSNNSHSSDAHASEDDQTDDSLSDDDEVQQPKSFRGLTEECKLILVVRTDLGMTKGSSIYSRSLSSFSGSSKACSSPNSEYAKLYSPPC